MMRRSPMPPSTTPLARRTPMPRSGPLPQVSAKRAATHANTGRPRWSTLVSHYKPAVPPKVKALIIKRSGDGSCEVALVGCYGAGTDPSHRKALGMGGRHGETEIRHNVASCYLWACRWCHTRIEAEPVWAKAPERGYKLHENAFPEVEPVLYRCERLVRLTDLGGVF